MISIGKLSCGDDSRIGGWKWKEYSQLEGKMTIAIAIEDVRREVKILRAFTRHNNLVQFYDAYEDHDNLDIVMELCEG
ncbi:CDPK-related protein kinase-like [Mercurialis annua]|uniref:CDPK-related protein kinase-like n=1 Tax=Mercurialis annua TaxID=3986 RepID=UPI00216105F4|nr:CDPK-related protein kinase-like [Mercurialis annua]